MRTEFVVHFSYGDALYLRSGAVALRSHRTDVCWCIPVIGDVHAARVAAFCGKSSQRLLTEQQMIAINSVGAKGLLAHENNAAFHLGDSLAERNGWLVLRSTYASTRPGEVICHYYPQPSVSAYDFRRTYGWSGDADPLPMRLRHVVGSLFRNEAGRDLRLERGTAADVTVIPILKPMKGVPDGTDFRWSSTDGCWERLYRTRPYWRSCIRIIGAERSRTP